MRTGGTPSQGEADWQLACTFQELQNTGRLLRVVSGRQVVVLLHRGSVFALDALCFHQGGPVGECGDIEEVGGEACIKCPWHGRKISLATGCQRDTGLDGSIIQSDPVQRVHPLHLDSGTSDIWISVQDEAAAPGVQSDIYNSPSPPATKAKRSCIVGASEWDAANRILFGSDDSNDSEPQPLTPYCLSDKRAIATSPSQSVPGESRTMSQAATRRALARAAVARNPITPPISPASSFMQQLHVQDNSHVRQLFTRPVQDALIHHSTESSMEL